MDKYREVNRQAYDAFADHYRRRLADDATKDPALLESFFGLLEERHEAPVRVLDLGCGNGLNLQMMVERKFIACGVDISERMCDLARSVSPKAIILNQDFLDCQFSHSSFEGVLSKASIHMFTKADAMLVLHRLYELLTPKGVLFVATTHHPSAEEGFYTKREYSPPIMRYRKYWTPEELTDAMLDSGFEILSTFSNKEPKWKKHWFNIIATKA